MKSQRPEKKKSPTYVPSGMSLAGDAYLKRNLHVHESVDVLGHLNVAGQVELNRLDVISNLNVSARSRLNKLQVNGIATFAEPVNVKATFQAKYIFVEDKIVAKDMLVKDAIVCDKIESKLSDVLISVVKERMTVNGSTFMKSDCFINGTVNVDHNFNVVGKGYIGNDLLVSGEVVTNGAITVTENGHVKRHFRVGGKTECHDNVTINNDLSVKKDARIIGSLYCKVMGTGDIKTEDATIKNVADVGYLNVAKDIDIYGNMRANNACFTGKVIVRDDVELAKDLKVKDVLCETFKTKSIHCEGDTTIAGDVIIKKGLCVGDHAALNVLHCQTLAIAEGNVISDIYEPSISSIKNVNFYQAYDAQYQQIGSIVTVSGRVDIEPQAEGDTHVELSLPIQSNLKETHHLSGTASSQNGYANASCYADVVTNRCQLSYHAVCVDKLAFFFTFTYRIL